MNKLFLPILAISGILAVYEQSKSKPNIYVMIGAIVIFMFCMMKLSAKVPSKNEDKSDSDV